MNTGKANLCNSHPVAPATLATMAMLLIPAVFLFGVSMVLLCLAIAGMVLTLAFRVIAGVLWVAIKITEHRSAAEPEILIIIEDDERPIPMKDVTPRLKALNAPRPTQGD